MDIEAIRKIGKLRTYQKGEFICREGEVGATAFLLLQGSAKTVINSYSKSNKTVFTFVPGTVFGEMSLLEGAPRSATILVVESGTAAIEMEEPDFLKLLAADTDLSYKLCKNMLVRLDNMLNIVDSDNKRLVFQYTKQEKYQTIATMNYSDYVAMVKENPKNIFLLLKFLSQGISQMNRLANHD